LQELNRQLAREGQPAMRLRIGVHSGPVVAGSVGSRERWEFGVVGDTVNCAARIEALDKERGGSPCRVLVSGVTRARVQNQLAGPWRDWGTVALSGRSTAVEIWELVPASGDHANLENSVQG
ncbi:MAG: adenylate/guanylate cyclase domain-containing protein, partial [Cyanobacteriota bacterium]